MVTGSSSMAEDSPLPRPNVWTDQVEARCFAWRALPTELQQSIIALAVQPGSCVSIVALLCTCRSIYNLALPVVYSHINLSSITQTVALLDGKSLDREKERNKLVAESGDGPSGTATKHARCFSFSLVGVPGGNPRGGRESALSSPERRERAQQDNDSSARSNARPSEAGQTVSGSITSALGNERLLLAARAMLLCPMLEQCSISMFGKRHSFLTSPAYLADEAGSFRDALAQLQHLRSFAWVTPRENDNFVGFSVAVVDLAFPPMIEGLQTAALDMTADGRRVKRPVGALDRYAHPLESITLHHAIFPTSKYPRDSFFCLFAQGHPDDSDWALFPRLYRIVIRTACNINPRDVAYLALSWQLRVDKAMQEMLSAVEQYQLNCSPEWNPVMELSDVFVNSIWGPRVSLEQVREEIEGLVNVTVDSGDERETDAEGTASFGITTGDSETHADPSIITSRDQSGSSANPYIRALEECTDETLRLNSTAASRIRRLSARERSALIDAAVARVHIYAVQGAIAGD